MKRMCILAAGLMLSGSGLAMAGDTKPMKPLAEADWASPVAQASKSAMAPAATGAPGGDIAKQAAFAAASTPALASASDDKKAAHQGLGGPYEEVTARSEPLETVEAVKNYPACEPGPGDDHCIQLYEPGVRTALASWQGEGGGLWTGESAVAMGGPFEPAETGEGVAMNGDGIVEAHLGEAPGMEVTAGATYGETAYEGVGGPVEAVEGYPPCSPGPGDDRCIQLYERGVARADD